MRDEVLGSEEKKEDEVDEENVATEADPRETCCWPGWTFTDDVVVFQPVEKFSKRPRSAAAEVAESASDSSSEGEEKKRRREEEKKSLVYHTLWLPYDTVHCSLGIPRSSLQRKAKKKKKGGC
ncbi:uncharacterized protein ARB_04363 [Trichophyton benhamiae CBS 112371]|uniref:Uncharacterized protein n=1 Tax=Arthroderma benhamiae (strain ATCC MYA-4681 / CBS 112371) TaxID=663331 RepID=D4AJB4_ARTBC|nr:uncharacterized protein ARB_04363 [Trichophyton benhamiae CBS 112371]EFE36837.1 hypothetical protein ARB_04363 [Trichophyton benhamiae CBS 112371]